jgi:predicted metal-dependent hydrolase
MASRSPRRPTAPAPAPAPKTAQLSLFEPPPAPAIEGPVLLLPNLNLPYTLGRSRRRTIGFSVSTKGLRVTAPRWVSLTDIEGVLRTKSDWILRKWHEVKSREQRLEALKVDWQDGAEMPYLGQTLRLRWSAGRALKWTEAEAEQPAQLWLPLPNDATEAQWRDAVQAWLQAQARQRFLPRLAHFADKAGVPVPKLRLSGAHTRWGSASSRGVVSLNWRLIHFSPAVMDYVIAHEVAHLREMNHSPRFWAVVEQLMPGYEVQREVLRDAVVPPF